MGVFNLSSGINPNKIFIINRSEIEGRLEAEYYRPEINLLEKKLREKTSKRLKDFIIKVASGATPSVTEEDKYYSDEDNGIPFLRVQNLQPNGKLYLEDLKYINKQTHKKYLKRSQVAEGDLLVKITGVGRMAIASVAPEGFVGNTNQHMVVIKTENRKTSEYLANFLNLDITEKLATRRSTGATRPALDYPAIKSLPIVEGIDFSKLNQAEIQNQKKKHEAKKILNSINEYLQNELGIHLLPKVNTLENRIFNIKRSEISNGRFDPFYNDLFYSNIEKYISNGIFNFKPLKELCYNVSGVIYSSKNERPSGKAILRANNITLETNELNYDDIRYIDESIELSNNQKLKQNDIFMCTASGSKEHVGKVAYIENDLNYYFGGFMMVLRQRNNTYSQKFLFEYLCSNIFRLYLFRILGGTNINNLNFGMLSNLLVPLPKKEKQEEIVETIRSIREKAKTIQNEAKIILDSAKNEIEKKITEK